MSHPGQIRAMFFAALGLSWAASIVPVPAGETGAPEVRIISPTPRQVAVGKTRIVAEATPVAGRQLVAVRFFVDGEPLAELTAPPYEAVFDAGASFAPRTLRVEAEDDLGRVGVYFSSTRYVSFLEQVVVEAEVVVKRSVLVSVLGPGHEPLLDLRPEEFTLRVDGKSEILLEAARDRRPLAVELQLDVSGSIARYLALVNRAATGFVSLMDEGDGTEVSVFAGSSLAISPYSSDHVATRQAIRGVLADPFRGLLLLDIDWNGTRLYDAMAHSVETINVRPGQRSIVVFTDAFDAQSRFSRDQIFDVIRRSNLRIDAVRFGRRQRGNWSLGSRQIKMLRKLVHETGGQEWRIKYPENIAPAFQALARQLKARYRLVFAADPRAGSEERYRKIRVSVDRPHVRVLAPTGFYDGGTTLEPEDSQNGLRR